VHLSLEGLFRQTRLIVSTLSLQLSPFGR
jgi:hypothetical protein